jgi:glycosyltransferase involved in cell wall biosynthesis
VRADTTTAHIPLFSVVIPTHNREALLQRALRSVGRQTLGDYEVIVVDDASRDATPMYLASLPPDQCRSFRNEINLGVSGSRNRGASAARGECLVFLDDDDALRPDALERLRAASLAHPESDFLWGARCVHQKDLDGNYVTSRLDDWSAVREPVSGSGLLTLTLDIATNTAFTIRRSVFAALGGFDEQLTVSEDRDLFIRLARGGYLGFAVPHVIIDVDEHFNNSLSRNTGVRTGPAMDLRVLEKHREYLARTEHRQFVNRYLVAVFRGFLQANDRTSALRVIAELLRRGALSAEVLRLYVRHAPEFRLLKRLLRYDALRRLRLARAATPHGGARETAPDQDHRSKN